MSESRAKGGPQASQTPHWVEIIEPKTKVRMFANLIT